VLLVVVLGKSPTNFSYESGDFQRFVLNKGKMIMVWHKSIQKELNCKLWKRLNDKFEKVGIVGPHVE
jgi:hypothetical protein